MGWRTPREIPPAEAEVSTRFCSRLREKWRKQWDFDSREHLSYLQLAFLLLVFVLPSVAGRMWGPLWGTPLGGVAGLLWLVYGRVPYLGVLGEKETTIFEWGLLGIMAQTGYQMFLCR